MNAAFILVGVILFADGGTQGHSVPFATQAECVAELPKVAASIAEYNATKPEKVSHFVAACMPLIEAPQGRSI